MLDKFKEINWNPDELALRKFCKTLLIGFPIAGLFWLGIAKFISGDWILDILFWFTGIGWVTGIGGMLIYPFGLLFYKFWFFIIAIIDTILTTTLMFTFFYFLLSPYSIFARLFKKDSMNRKIDTNLKSYFEDIQMSKSPNSYYKQY